MIINNKRKRKMKINSALFRKLSILLSFSLFLSLLTIFIDPASVTVDGPLREIKCENCEPKSMNYLSFTSKLLFDDKENFLNHLCPIISPLLGKIYHIFSRFIVIN